MKLLEFNAYKSSMNNASSKAKIDVSQIITGMGYSPIYSPSKFRLIRMMQQLLAILRIPKESILFIQYQSHIPLIYKLLSIKKGVNKVAILHDLESLRGKTDIEKEIKILNRFDFIIDHNPSMREYLIKNGLYKPIEDINIFDYLLDNDIKANSKFDKKTIFFAGNLSKSYFLRHLRDIKNLHFNLYGASFDGIDNIRKQTNVTYKGSFSPNELISNIEGGWGLVWDGDDLSTCSGMNGEYMRFNNPHKVSMCIVSERPVIIWSQSAMAKYIDKKGIGICIDSLFELHDKLQNISDSQYRDMLNRVKEEKLRLTQGLNLIEKLELFEKQLGFAR